MKYYQLLFTLLFSLCCLPVWAASQSLRVVTEELPPYNYLSPQGTLSGASMQIVQALLEILRLEAKIEILPWARAYKEAMSKPNVLIFSLLRTSQRESDFHWLSPITPINIRIFALPSAGIAPFTNLNTLGSKTLAVVRNSSQVDYVKRHQSVDLKNLIIGRSFEQLYRMNMMGRVDLFMAPELLVYYLNNKLKVKKAQQPVVVYSLPARLQRKLYLALSKTTPIRTVQRFKMALNKMHRNGKIAAILKDFELQMANAGKNRSIAK